MQTFGAPIVNFFPNFIIEFSWRYIVYRYIWCHCILFCLKFLLIIDKNVCVKFETHLQSNCCSFGTIWRSLFKCLKKLITLLWIISCNPIRNPDCLFYSYLLLYINTRLKNDIFSFALFILKSAHSHST